MAEVVDVNDPKQMGRVRVRVQGIHDDVPDSDLPWAIPTAQSTEFNSIAVPVKGREVYVRGVDGDMQEFEYSGLVRSEGGEGLPAALKVNYPHRKGYVTEYGVESWRDEIDGTMSMSSPLGGMTCRLLPDGTLEVSDAVRIRLKVGGSMITMAPSSIVIEAPATVRISAPFVNVTG